MNNKKGMTLIELLVYMAIAALLLTPVVMLMQNSSKNMARDAITTDLHISGSDILNIMYEDIRNTGFKLKDASGMVSDEFVHAVETITPPTTGVTPPNGVYDSSSFKTGNGAGAFDELIVYKGRLNRNTGIWEGYDIIAYNVVADRLARDRAAYNDAGDIIPDSSSTWIIARNVEALQFQYSADMTDWEDAPTFTPGQTPSSSANKRDVKYIKIAVVTVDHKKLSPVKTSPEITVGDHTYNPPDDLALREVSEIVVPIPNNGLFP